MLKFEILNKIIVLLHRERLLGLSNEQSSSSLARTIINNTDDSRVLKGGEQDIIDALIAFILSFIENPESYDTETIVDNLTLIYRDRPSYLASIKELITREIQDDSIKKSIVSIRNQLHDYYKEQEAKKILYSTIVKLNGKANKNETFREIMKNMISKVNAFTCESSYKDPAVIDNLDINDSEALSSTIDELKESENGTNLMISGWEELNTALQGGFRRGDFVIIPALQHKYKSGFVQSLVVQLAMHNKPVMKDPNRKPLIAFISFEDNRTKYIEFIYKYIYYNEFKKLPRLKEIDKSAIVSYIKDNLTVNGYHVKLLRVNPNEWTHENIINKIYDFEAEGYEVHACVVDYLSKISLKSVVNPGPAGTALREMFANVRNFMSSRNILFITPHQLSTSAKQLLTINGSATDIDFVKEVASKGYTEGSRQLDQIVDIEINIHIAELNGQDVLTVMIGKHRHASVIDDKSKKFFMLPFPKSAPILKTLNAPENKLNLDKKENNSDSIEKILSGF